jgi:hypothetical protein
VQNKTALKVVQNGQITMKDCRVPEADRLAAGAQSTIRGQAIVSWAGHRSAWSLEAEVRPIGVTESALARRAGLGRRRWRDHSRTE